ncbi:MAG: hypothetical protein EOP10_31240 [Proteobacteria bacterium]|nr:MAG: hypothetical protein EOP10_31240 [Pseudomonadota bacterium]
MNIKIWMSLALLFVLSSKASAQILTPSLSLIYFKEGSRRAIESTPQTNDSVKSQNVYTFVNLGVCYNLSGICLGLKYLQGEIESKSTLPGSSGTSKTVYTAPGLTVGYSGAEGIVAHASWLLGAKKTIEGKSTTYFAKSAWIAELGYGFKVSSVRIGPLLGIYNFKFNKRDVAGVKTDLRPNEQDDFILPQVALWVDL